MEGMTSGVDLGRGGFDEATGTHRFEFDREDTTASMAAIAAMAEVSGQDPTAMAPIQEHVDSDALDLLARAGTGTDGDVHVTWTQGDYQVTVHSYGVVAVAPLGGSHPQAPVEARSG